MDPAVSAQLILASDKIEQIWVDEPQLWFAKTESIFAIYNLVDTIMKYDLVVTKLTQDVITEVSDILMTPPSSDKYEELKERLISVYEESNIKRILKLLEQMTLGEEKPSVLLQRMQTEAHKKIPDDTIRTLWTNQLPASVRNILEVAESRDLVKLASMADVILKTIRPLEKSEPNIISLLEDIKDEIAKLSEEIANIQAYR